MNGITYILPAPGLHRNVASDEYQGWPATRTSHLKAALKSWHHFRRAETVPSIDKPEFIAGRAVHAAAFDPAAFAAEFMIVPKVNGSTREGKAAKKALAENPDPRTRLTTEDYAEIREWADALGADEAARKILSRPAENEVSMVWADEKTGIVCKGRIDRLIRTPRGFMIVDLKTAKDASPRKFALDAADYGYDLQAAQYVDGLRACTGADEIAFVWIVVEKESLAVECYSATDPDSQPDMLTNGRRRRDRLMRELVECRKTGVYLSYTRGIVPLPVPAFKIEPEVSE